MLAGVSERRGRCPTRWLVAGYAGLAGFFLLEGLLRQSASLRASGQDRGTTGAVVLAYAVASDVPLLSRWLPGWPLPSAAAPAGLLVQATGLALRAWSMRAWGASYTRTLRIEDGEQAVVDSGPYRWVRHPGYLGSLLTWVWFALTSRSAPGPCPHRRTARRGLPEADPRRGGAAAARPARLCDLQRADQEAHPLALVMFLSAHPIVGGTSLYGTTKNSGRCTPGQPSMVTDV